MKKKRDTPSIEIANNSTPSKSIKSLNTFILKRVMCYFLFQVLTCLMFMVI